MTSQEDFRNMIDRHMEAGTCYLCGEPVLDGQAHHGATGSHWNCYEAEKMKFEEACEKLDKIKLKELFK